ncbi:MAG TPA: prepilin-type N-terminal cleavage/methylation domain-containing protein [Isosphaeraceae bacterium]|nr:prepilin-type N-terminal cleavage/methylation domain-containing protein [Isosphaeraceae bacterium]
MIADRTVRTTAQRPAQPADVRRPGFTLIELLMVMLIILLVSAVTLPSIISAISHRQASEAARILQAALVGARDSAIHNNAVSGIRLLPDPTINGLNSSGILDITLPLAMNRVVPLEAAPDYDEGKVSIIKDQALYSPFPATPANSPWGFPYPYPASGSVNVLMIEECPVDTSTYLPNEPTSWFWNIRIGDKIRIGNAGQYYTVIGPMYQSNPELFVNDGAAGSPTQLVRTYTNPQNVNQTLSAHVEYLFLVNGQDDDNDGFVDDGWDGVDNNLNGTIDELAEWTEAEKWLGSLAGGLTAVETIVTSLPPRGPGTPPVPPDTPGLLNQSYTITRRPAPSSGSREVALPSNVVIDLTTWATTHERSRFPIPAVLLVNGGQPLLTSQVINPESGSVDILVNPDGTVVPSTVYSSPSSFGLNGAFLHFWLAERSDVTAPSAGTYSTLPLPAGLAPTNFATGAELKGEYSLVTVYSRTGQILVNSPPRFDNPANPANGSYYNLNTPFVDAQQGATGGNQ